jgi:hypothetical protein
MAASSSSIALEVEMVRRLVEHERVCAPRREQRE